MSDFLLHCAPLSGLTDAPFRRLHRRLLPGVDCYYVPFLHIDRGLLRKGELRDLAEEDDRDNTIAQILPANVDEMSRCLDVLAEKGFRRVDLNIACPQPPQMARGRGAALLNHPERLQPLLQKVEETAGQFTYSLKTRLGYDRPDQWRDVVSMVNAAPFAHVTFHGRIAKQQMGGTADLSQLSDVLRECRHPVLCSGDLSQVAQIEALRAAHPGLVGVMVGRGMLTNLLLPAQLKGVAPPDVPAILRELHEGLFEAARARMTDDRQVVRHMQAYWELLLPDADRKLHKAMRKAQRLDQYTAAAAALLAF